MATCGAGRYAVEWRGLDPCPQNGIEIRCAAALWGRQRLAMRKATVMREHRKPLSQYPVIRILVIWVIQALALVILTFLLSGLRVDSLWIAFAAAGVIGLLNALLWPLLSYVLLPFAVLTLGLLALVLNGAIIYLTAWIVDGFYVDNLWTAILAALGLTAINIIASTLLTIDDDNSWNRNMVRRRAKRIAKPEETDVPGVLFLEIDGMSISSMLKSLNGAPASNKFAIALNCSSMFTCAAVMACSSPCSWRCRVRVATST